MKEDSQFERLQQASWRGKLTPDEQARWRQWLRAHPQDRETLEGEGALNDALDRLRQVPISSNFTARVIAAALREGVQRKRAGADARLRIWTRLRWFPRLGFAAVILAAGLFAFHEVHQARQLGEIRQSVVTISPALADPEILQDFDTIQVISRAPAADDDLIRLLQ